MDIILRIIVIYLFILFGLRILGKREFSEMSPLELVTLFLIPEIVSQALVRESALITALIGVATLFSLVFIHSQLMHLSSRFERVVDGKPTILIEHGKLITDNLNCERLSPEEVYAELHMSGLQSLDQVRWGILETNGKIAFIAEDGEPSA